MALTLWTTAALVLWLVLWSLGSKAMDSAMAAIVILLIGATIHIVQRYLPNRD